MKITLLEAHFIKNKDIMCKVAKRRVGEFWCEDVVQEAYTRCIKYIDNIPEDATLVNAYLYTSLRNVMNDYLRGSVDTAEVEEDMLESGELVDDWAAQGVLDEIKKHMTFLPSPEKEVVYCALVQGESYEQISKINQVTIPSVKMMVYRYRKMLEGRYGKD